MHYRSELGLAIFKGNPLSYPWFPTVIVNGETVITDYPKGEDALYMTFTLISKQAEYYWKMNSTPPKLNVLMMSKVGGISDEIKSGDVITPTSVLSLSPKLYGDMSLTDILTDTSFSDTFESIKRVLEDLSNSVMDFDWLEFPNIIKTPEIRNKIFPEIFKTGKSGYAFSSLPWVSWPYLEKLRSQGAVIFEMELYFFAKLIEGMKDSLFLFPHAIPNIGYVCWVGWTPFVPYDERIGIDDDYPPSQLIAIDLIINSMNLI